MPIHFRLILQPLAKATLAKLEQDQPKKHKKVLKTLALMETNLRNPSLQTHKYNAIQGQNGEEVFESYVENRTPATFRVFWHYGPNPQEITIIAITPHP
jgi:hypothetical protein